MLTPPAKPYTPPGCTIPPAPLSSTTIRSGTVTASPLGWGMPILQPPSTQPSLHLSPMPSPPPLAELSQPDSPVSYVVRSPPPIVVSSRSRSCTPPPVIIQSRSSSPSPERVPVRSPETGPLPKPAGSRRFPTVVAPPSFVPQSGPAGGRRAFAMNSAVPPPSSLKPIPWRSQPQQPGIIPPAPLTPPITRPLTIPPASPIGTYPYDSWGSYYPAAAQPQPLPALQQPHPRFYFPDGTLVIHVSFRPSSDECHANPMISPSLTMVPVIRSTVISSSPTVPTFLLALASFPPPTPRLVHFI
jgi:hypothetical protein